MVFKHFLDDPKNVHLFGHDLVGDRFAPVFTAACVKTELGEYVTPRSGNILFKIVPKLVGTYEESNIFLLDTIVSLLNGAHTDPRATILKNNINYSSLHFVTNCRPYAVSSLHGVDEYQRNVPAVTIPAIIYGRLDDDKEANALCMPSDMFMTGEDPCEWETHARLNVFMLVTNERRIRLLITKYYSVKEWFRSPAGQRYSDKIIADNGNVCA